MPVGVATITPSAAYVVNALPLIDTSSRMRWPLRCFSSAASLSANHVPAAGPPTSTSHREHHALRHREVAGEQARQRRVELVGLDLGEVAELADVDAEDRHRRRVHEIDRVQHRAVAAERDHEIETVGEPVGRDAELARGRPPSPRRPGRAPRRRARANQPRPPRASSCATPPIAVRDEPDRARRRRAHARRPRARVGRRPASMSAGVDRRPRPRRACAKNSTLPSAPRSGDADQRAHAEARARRARPRPRAAPRRARPGRARSRPCRRAPGPPRTAASPAARSRRRRW